jgi:Protein of unknown function (DUF3072)
MTDQADKGDERGLRLNDDEWDMADDQVPSADPKSSPTGNAEKDPDDWVTGDEAMTGAQASYLKTLSEQAGEAFDPTLSKAAASKRIDELKQRTGRGA